VWPTGTARNVLTIGEEPAQLRPGSQRDKSTRKKKNMLILIIVLVLLLGGGGGYYGHSRWGYGGGAGVSLGTILLILLIAWMLGLFR
jgi:hypothetical protein